MPGIRRSRAWLAGPLGASVLGAGAAAVVLCAGASVSAAADAAGHYYCTGTVISAGRSGGRSVDRRSATTVVLEVAAGRVVLIGVDGYSALEITGVEHDGARAIYHFGGIGDELVYTGSFSAPDFRLRAAAVNEELRIDISMSCEDGGPPPLLF